MQFNAYVIFEAATEEAAADVVSGWGLEPGTTVTLTPVAAPVMATVDDDGSLKAYEPPAPPTMPEAEEEAE